MLQSVANAMGAPGLKFLMPFSHWLMISSFDDVNAASSSGDHEKGILAESRCLNGAITGAEAKA